ncbi:hypothetical protein [Maridesulfovibrio sp. FT414]|uniref:hypothetical protein n=1 Tax=Maridesulfovibrio sp. FT414 TaxID=2979469 RepID=UPI003D8009D8
MSLPGCNSRDRFSSSGLAHSMRSFQRSRQTSYCFCQFGGQGFMALSLRNSVRAIMKCIS